MTALVLGLMVAVSDDVGVAHRRVTTADGAAVALYRYRVEGLRSPAPPLLLVPELGFSRALFDFEHRGLARWLAAQGREVYVAELRGQGKADPALSLEHFATDVDAVLKHIDAAQVDLVVQGWAGALLMSSIAEARVRRVVAMNVLFEPEVPNQLAERFLMNGARFSSLASSPEGAHVFEQLFGLRAEMPVSTFHALLATGTRDLSRPVAAELLAWMRHGDRPIHDSSVKRRLIAWRRPTLLMLGLADGFAPPELCAGWRDHNPNVSIRTFTRLEAGDDFSRASMLLGTRAPSFVFPEVLEFLR